MAIAEDERASIFSGSVVVDRHNSSGFGRGDGSDHAPPLVAVYTACLRKPEGGQAQELAFSLDRGRSWTKFAGNPVLDLGQRDFRDPKVFWHESTARWVMVVVLPDERKAQFYASHNLRQWQWLSDFSAPFEGQGIWECPDLIPLPDQDGRVCWLLKVDVLAGHPSGGTGARIFFGHFDGQRFVTEPQTEHQAEPRWADHGADFYAALSWNDVPAEPSAPGAQQRQVWLAWMNCHRYAKHLPTQPWRGSMSLPRELSLRRGALGWQLRQWPVAGVQSLRDQRFVWPAHLLHNEEVQVLACSPAGRALEVCWELRESAALECGLVLRSDHGDCTRVGYDAAARCVFVDRSQSGFCPPDDALYAQRRSVPVAAPSAAQPLRISLWLDWASVEVFVGDGEQVLTEQIFPGGHGQGLSLYAREGTAQIEAGQGWTLRAAALS